MTPQQKYYLNNREKLKDKAKERYNKKKELLNSKKEDICNLIKDLEFIEAKEVVEQRFNTTFLEAIPNLSYAELETLFIKAACDYRSGEYLPAHFNLINNNDRNMARKSKTTILAENFINSLKDSDSTKKYYVALKMEELISICYKKDRYLYNTILNMVVDHCNIYEYGVKVGDEITLEEYLKDVIGMILNNSLMINRYVDRILFLTCSNNKKEVAEK